MEGARFFVKNCDLDKVPIVLIVLIAIDDEFTDNTVSVLSRRSIKDLLWGSNRIDRRNLSNDICRLLRLNYSRLCVLHRICLSESIEERICLESGVLSEIKGVRIYHQGGTHGEERNSHFV